MLRCLSGIVPDWALDAKARFGKHRAHPGTFFGALSRVLLTDRVHHAAMIQYNGLLRRIFRGWCGIDPFYSAIPAVLFDRYDSTCAEILSKIETEDLTLSLLNRPCNAAAADATRFQIESLVDAAESKGLIGNRIQVALYQYLLADPVLRENARNNWVSRVARRKKVDIFPDASAIAEMCFQQSW